MKKIVTLLLAVLLLVGLFAGCAKSTGASTPTPAANNSGTNTNTNTNQSTNTETNDAEEPADANGLPLAEGASFVLWYGFNSPTAVSGITTYADSDVWKELVRRTGVTVEVINPASANNGAQQAFNLIIASNDLPDAMYTRATWWVGGLDKAIDDDYILDVKELIEENAPNMKQYMNKDYDLLKSCYTDTGRVPTLPLIQHQSITGQSVGLCARGDWMEALGLSAPATFDEMHELLVKFKEAYGVDMFINQNGISTHGTFLNGFNLSEAFRYDENGGVVFSRTLPNMKKYVTLMHQWYEEGLIDPDFISNPNVEEAFWKGEIGVADNMYNVYIGKVGLDRGVATDPNLNIVALPEPKETPDTVMHTGIKNSYSTEYAYRGGFEVTTQAEDPVLITKWFNYCFTDDGILLTNYGFEGDTFEYVNGKPVWTDKIANNPDVPDLMSAQQKWLWHFPPYSEFDKEFDTYPYQEQLDSPGTWGGDTDLAWALPQNYTLTSDEGARYSALYNDIATYTEEHIVKFIIGQEDIEANWDGFVSQVQSMGIDEVCGLLQAACDRYNAR